jgi:prepilin peptidase CpaA
MPFDVDVVMIAWTLFVSAIAAVLDLRSGLIPNRLVLVALTVGVTFCLVVALTHGFNHLPLAGLNAVLGAIVCSLAPLILYSLKSLGGGDLKLLVALGACLGPSLGFETQAYAFASASIYAFGRAAYEGTMFRTLADSATVLTQPLLPRTFRKPVAASTLRELRFAPAIFFGVLIAAVSHGVAP